MRMYDLIAKKRDGKELSSEEIDFMVREYTNGSIPDYQMSAMLMAIFCNGMNKKETLALTLSMRDSGDVLDLSAIRGIKTDKHSTGGVGDKTSITLGPLVASVGVKVAKMSGRGLGHTGGTIDKLESFPGFTTGISTEHFYQQVNEIGISIMGQTADLAPADKKLYALRDVTATVNNISLIASSIMSKKLASGADAIVLDVKCGSGAFMKDFDSAKALAREMVEIGKGAGKNTKAFITDMEQPLGNAVGNALEVKEAIETLKGNGPEDFTTLCMTLGAAMVVAAEIAPDEASAIELLEESIQNGNALNKLAEFVAAQGGDANFVYQPDLLPKAAFSEEIYSGQKGYITAINCEEVGICSLLLGGGRETKESEIDLAVGIVLHKKIGDYADETAPIATIHYNDKTKFLQAKERFLKAFSYASQPVENSTIILDKVII